MMRFLNLFKPQVECRSYAYPILKMLICFVLILFALFRRYIYHIPENLKVLSIVESVLFFQFCIFLILFIYISVVEITMIYENRKRRTADRSISTKRVALEDVITAVKENDIIEYEVISNEGVVRLGCSSDYKHTNNKFFDKRFYIEDAEYSDVDQFRQALLPYATNDIVFVAAIDGVKAMHLHNSGASK